MLVVGGPQVEVVRADAAKHRDVRFVVVDGGASGAANVAVAKPDVKLKDTMVDEVRREHEWEQVRARQVAAKARARAAAAQIASPAEPVAPVVVPAPRPAVASVPDVDDVDQERLGQPAPPAGLPAAIRTREAAHRKLTATSARRCSWSSSAPGRRMRTASGT
ncbi:MULTISPECIES: hypothetical protein [Streptomyces]|uniref:Uncharacterized protein n=1 Tax=Streptomyces griseosporeus TaxID=1910 RepID=A0ABV3KWB3_STRGS|nr:hypothetical protein [Streptomyces actuosus]MBM4824035.1 hypothetical protein [Streptomyces actuosus]